MIIGSVDKTAETQERLLLALRKRVSYNLDKWFPS